MSPLSRAKKIKRALVFISLKSEACLLQVLHSLFPISGLVYFIDYLFILSNPTLAVIDVVGLSSFLLQIVLSWIAVIALFIKIPKLYLTSIVSVGLTSLSYGMLFFSPRAQLSTRTSWEEYICIILGAILLLFQPYFIYIFWNTYKMLRAAPNYRFTNTRTRHEIQSFLTL